MPIVTSPTVINLDDERLIMDGEAAVDLYNKDIRSARSRIMPMARGLLAAKRKYPATQDFGDWLQTSSYRELEKDDRADLIKIGEHDAFAEKFVRTTSLVSPQTIWSAISELLPTSYDTNSTQNPTSIPNSPSSPATEPKPEEPEAPNVEIETQKSTKRKSTSRLYELGDTFADSLLAKFKHPKMLTHFLGEKNGTLQKRSRLLRYLAKRIELNYPIELFDCSSWDIKLLYPYLPQKLLDAQTKTPRLVHKNHLALAATEELFVKTPEFGVTDPPNVAFNKAWSIYQSIIHSKSNTFTSDAHIHKPTFVNDGGKPPIIVRGTQLWPAETGTGYGYDDLRCAYNLANDIVLTFGEPRDAPISTKSLKLRHIMSWLPGGYNSFGSSIDGTLKALAAVVHAYGTNKSDVMRAPPPSLKKLGE